MTCQEAGKDCAKEEKEPMLPESYRWETVQVDEDKAARIREDTGCHPLLARLLAARGIEDGTQAYRFLNPSPAQLLDPFRMKGMEEAAKRICRALDQEERITIYGDYDVDGITATSILYLFLQDLIRKRGGEEGADPLDYYLPDRAAEGYGMNPQAVQTIAGRGTRLIITVDTGISAVRECQLAKELGMDVIVTDHHECPPELPDCVSIIDAKQPGETYPYRHLAGCGVAFKLVQALALRTGYPDDVLHFTELAAVGTVADIVELTGENRIIVSEGFRRMKDPANPGLYQLLKSAGYDFSRKITASFIGFGAAPRLNAGGRMGDAARGVRLFTTKDSEEADRIAQELSGENESRRQVEQEILKSALDQIEASPEMKNSRVIIVTGRSWHHGVIGIVSSRIKDLYYRPNIVFSVTDGMATGSARSIPGFDLFQALSSCSDLFERYGGHAAAAGMTLKEEKLGELTQRLNQWAVEKMDARMLTPVLKVEAKIPVSEISTDLVGQIEKMEPFGQGMPQPLIEVEGVLDEIRPVGADMQTLRIRLTQAPSGQDMGRSSYYARIPSVTGVAFRKAVLSRFYREGSRVLAAGNLSLNRYMGRESAQIIVSDIHGMIDESLRSLCHAFSLRHVDKSFRDFGRMRPSLHPDALKDTWRFLRSRALPAEQGRGRSGDEENDCRAGQISLESLISGWREDPQQSLYSFLQCLAVFEELGLARVQSQGPYLAYQLWEGKQALLRDSLIFQERFSSSAGGKV